jgi:hypothetical protein
MKPFVRDIMIGFILIALVTVIQWIVSLLMGGNDGLVSTPQQQKEIINLLFYYSLVPSVLLYFLAVYVTKPETHSQAFKSSLVWSGVFLFNYLVIGIGNSTFIPIFTGLGFYVLFIGVLVAPNIGSRLFR